MIISCRCINPVLSIQPSDSLCSSLHSAVWGSAKLFVTLLQIFFLLQTLVHSLKYPVISSAEVWCHSFLFSLISNQKLGFLKPDFTQSHPLTHDRWITVAGCVSNDTHPPFIHLRANRRHSVGFSSNLVLTLHLSRLSAESWMALDKKKRASGCEPRGMEGEAEVTPVAGEPCWVCFGQWGHKALILC